MEWTKKLNSSEKKQFIGLILALIATIVVVVLIFMSFADKPTITYDEARDLSPAADRIDKLAIDLSRLSSTTAADGSKISQYELQNPTDGGAGDDGSYDSAQDVMIASVKEVNTTNESVALANGMTVEQMERGRTAQQINTEQRNSIEKAKADAMKIQADADRAAKERQYAIDNDVPASNTADVIPSVPANMPVPAMPKPAAER